jgi:hypothetical protein
MATHWETIRLKGDQVVGKIRELLHEGNVRRVVIKQGGQSVAEFPLTVGVVGAVAAPILAAVGALAALLTECTIEVERREEPVRTAVTKKARPAAKATKSR